jgi:hypothetical protein
MDKLRGQVMHGASAPRIARRWLWLAFAVSLLVLFCSIGFSLRQRSAPSPTVQRSDRSPANAGPREPPREIDRGVRSPPVRDRPPVEAPVRQPEAEPNADLPILVALGSFASTLATFAGLVFTWRKERRDSEAAALDLQMKRLQLEQLMRAGHQASDWPPPG